MRVKSLILIHYSLFFLSYLPFPCHLFSPLSTQDEWVAREVAGIAHPEMTVQELVDQKEELEEAPFRARQATGQRLLLQGYEELLYAKTPSQLTKTLLGRRHVLMKSALSTILAARRATMIKALNPPGYQTRPLGRLGLTPMMPWSGTQVHYLSYHSHAHMLHSLHVSFFICPFFTFIHFVATFFISYIHGHGQNEKADVFQFLRIKIRHPLWNSRRSDIDYGQIGLT
jgi:hypothetical protein